MLAGSRAGLSGARLTAQLIALDTLVPPDATVFYGAVTLGSVWQFGFLDGAPKQVHQDSNLFRVPQDLPDLASTLVGILVPTAGGTEPI